MLPLKPYVPVDAQEAAFLESFARRPEDLALRAIYADWLEERGDPWRAGFVRLWLEAAPALAADSRWRPVVRRFERHAATFDFDWQRQVFDPPIPLAIRADRRWLGAILGGAEERAALGHDAPPLLTDAVIDTNLFWGWPSPVLFRLAFAATRDLVEACAATPATASFPRAHALSVIERFEEAAAAGRRDAVFTKVPLLPHDPGKPDDPVVRAYNNVAGLHFDLEKLLAPYQARYQAHSRPGTVVAILASAAYRRLELGRTSGKTRRRHAAREQAVRIAEAAARRAEKAQRELDGAPARLEAVRVFPKRTLAELTHRRDRTRAIAAEARQRADALVAAVPEPTYHEELRALLARIGPGTLAWLRAQPDFEPDRLLVDHVEEVIDEDPHRRRVRTEYAADGRATTTSTYEPI